MADLALRWDPDSLTADLVVEGNDLARDATLQTAVELSLWLDRRAEDADQLPTSETDRRGWWGDSVPVVEGDRIGSRLWLLAREKQTPSMAARLEKYAREALAWLLEDRVASRLEVTATFPRAGMWGLTVELWRPGADSVRYQFGGAWEDLSPPPQVPLELPEDIGVVDADDAFFATSEGYPLTTV